MEDILPVRTVYVYVCNTGLGRINDRTHIIFKNREYLTHIFGANTTSGIVPFHLDPLIPTRSKVQNTMELQIYTHMGLRDNKYQNLGGPEQNIVTTNPKSNSKTESP